MAREDESRSMSASESEAHAHLLYESLDQYTKERKKRKRPSVILTALIVLFLSSAGGIALAVVLMVQVAEAGATSLSRDLVLFAASMSLLYIGLHIRGARKDYKRIGPGPPQLYGHYLHASALLVSRVGIIIWITAFIATTVMIARALIPSEGFLGKVPYLNLMLCIGAIPSFFIISVTIERNRTPFATAAISDASFLTCRVSEFADDIATDSSVSRQSSLQRKQSKTTSVLTVQTGEIFRLGGPERCDETMTGPNQLQTQVDGRTDGVGNTPMREIDHIPIPSLVPLSPALRTRNAPDLTSAPEVPQPAYYPGGWRAEWNNVAEEVGVDRISETSPDGSTSTNSSSLSSSQASQVPTPVRNSVAANPTNTQRQPLQRLVTASTSIASSAARSNLSTVRYAAQPEIAVRQVIKVVPNPAYRPPRNVASEDQPQAGEKQHISKPDPVVLLRNTQKTDSETQGAQGPRRKPSNFSRPIRRTKSQSDIDSVVD